MDSKELTQNQIYSLVELYSNGEAQEAIVKLDSLIINYPNEPILFNLLGACHAACGNLELAIKNCNKATSLNPDYAEAYFNLGGIYHQLNKLDESIDNLNKAISIDPEFPEVYNNLGKIFQEIFKPLDALEQFENALKYNPDFPEAHFNLGVTLNSLDRKSEAVEHFEQCIDLNPNSILAMNNLGKTFKELGKLSLAEDCFKNIIELDSEFAEAHNNLGAVFQDLGLLNDAIQCYENSISIAPNSTTLNNLGIVFQELGRLDEAAKSFQKAILLNSDSVDSYHNLSYLTNLSKNEAIINKMMSIHSDENRNLADRSIISLALAKTYENQGNLKDFFKFLHEGNSLHKKELGYSIEEQIKEMNAIKRMFSSSAQIKNSYSLEPAEKKIIFILGMPRSGTTLVEQILSSHKQVYGAGELITLTQLVKPLISNFIEDETATIGQQTFSFIHQEYTDMLTNLNFSENTVTDKLPLNFQYIGFILASFPDAKIIHLNRDPIATCWSNYRCSFTNRANGYSYDFDDLIKFYKLYKDLMAFWGELYPKKFLNLSYENLTQNQEKETRKLLDYCGLDWDENCLNFHNNKRGVQTASTIQVRKKMYQGSSEDWKKYWTYLQPLIDGLKSV
jgi:tetratricopeptide (TPR) repeat protein